MVEIELGKLAELMDAGEVGDMKTLVLAQALKMSHPELFLEYPIRARKLLRIRLREQQGAWAEFAQIPCLILAQRAPLFAQHSFRNFAARPWVGNRVNDYQKNRPNRDCYPERQDKSPSEKQGELHVAWGRSSNDSPIIACRACPRGQFRANIKATGAGYAGTRSERQSPRAIKNDKHTNSIKPIADWIIGLISVSGVAAWPISRGHRNCWVGYAATVRTSITQPIEKNTPTHTRKRN